MHELCSSTTSLLKRSQFTSSLSAVSSARNAALIRSHCFLRISSPSPSSCPTSLAVLFARWGMAFPPSRSQHVNKQQVHGVSHWFASPISPLMCLSLSHSTLFTISLSLHSALFLTLSLPPSFSFSPSLLLSLFLCEFRIP